MQVVVTGANGFLGSAVVRWALADPRVTSVAPVPSPRGGGPDLSRPDGAERLADAVPTPDTGPTVVVHAAAVVDWDTPRGRTANLALAEAVAEWASSTGVETGVFVSAVNVYPTAPLTTIESLVAPPSPYGAGKLAAEERLTKAFFRFGVFRLAGIWGFQDPPRMFWNRLLWRALTGPDGSPPPVVDNVDAVRNYIHVDDAAAVLVEGACGGLSGTHLVAGPEPVSLGRFVERLRGAPGSRLDAQVTGGRREDTVVFEPTPEVRPFIRGFAEAFDACWAERPLAVDVVP